MAFLVDHDGVIGCMVKYPACLAAADHTGTPEFQRTALGIVEVKVGVQTVVLLAEVNGELQRHTEGTVVVKLKLNCRHFAGQGVDDLGGNGLCAGLNAEVQTHTALPATSKTR
mgnify:CR=1 FL=1